MPSGSIRNRILAIFFVALLVLLLVFLPLISGLIQNLLKNNVLTFTKQTLTQVNNSIDIYVNEMRFISDYIVGNSEITNALKNRDKRDETMLQVLISTAQGFRPDFVSMSIFSEDGRFFSGRNNVILNANWDYHEEDWYLDALAAAGEAVLSASHVSHVFEGDYPWVVSLSRAIYSEGRPVAVLLIELNFAQIEAICRDLNLADDGYVFILGKNKEWVYHPQQQLIYSGIKSEPINRIPLDGSPLDDTSSQSIYLAHSTSTYGWTIIGVVSTKNFFPIQPLLWGTFSVLIGFFLLVYLAVNITLKYNIHEPLKDLTTSIRAFQKGHFGARANIHVNNELDLVGDSFNNMTSRIEALIHDTKQIAEEKRRSELQTLQSQIRPHFLYNTLESIIWTAELGDNEDVIAMTSSLAKLLRASNANADHLISLQQEMEYTNHYLIIQKMRYREKLDYTLTLPEKLKSARVLQLCIQPLVENAIYHGLKPLKEGGKINVDCWTNGSELFIRVSDNGVGFELDDFSVHSVLPNVSPNLEGGIGLANVQERLKLYFGPSYGISFISREQQFSEIKDDALAEILNTAPALPFAGGTSIVLHLPYITSESEYGEEHFNGSS